MSMAIFNSYVSLPEGRGWDFYHKDKTFLSGMLAAWNIDAR